MPRPGYIFQTDDGGSVCAALRRISPVGTTVGVLPGIRSVAPGQPRRSPNLRGGERHFRARISAADVILVVAGVASLYDAARRSRRTRRAIMWLAWTRRRARRVPGVLAARSTPIACLPSALTARARRSARGGHDPEFANCRAATFTLTGRRPGREDARVLGRPGRASPAPSAIYGRASLGSWDRPRAVDDRPHSAETYRAEVRYLMAQEWGPERG